MAAFSMIVLILLQRSEGGALGMGGGGGGFVTGRAAANFLTKITAGLAAVFFVTSLSLGVLSHRPAPTSAVGGATQTAPAQAPAGRAKPRRRSFQTLRFPSRKRRARLLRPPRRPRGPAASAVQISRDRRST